ncbi:MAG: hypothetical protein ACI8VC_002735 [Candidatus Endobugula sp.]|jgi:hypothetical protein
MKNEIGDRKILIVNYILHLGGKRVNTTSEICRDEQITSG